MPTSTASTDDPIMTERPRRSGPSPTQLATRARYGATQLPRLAWYVGHGLAMRRLATQARAQGLQARPTATTDSPVPSERQLYQDLATLMRRDLENVEAGIYPLPRDRDGTPAQLLRRSALFFSDLEAVNARREENRHSDVLTEDTRGTRPRYYLQNFHFQTGGWMTDESAERYDTQVEVLFNGTANAMRRQGIVPLHAFIAGRDQRRLKLLDVATGTGRFLDFVKQAFPRLPVTALDLSEPYTRAAAQHLRRRSWVNAIVAKGEQIPMPDASHDLVTSVFLFHELPPKVRAAVFAEMARVLKPGGRMVIVDALQRGDVPGYDGLLEMFPQNFHEPYFTTYMDTDFSAFADDAGLETRLMMPAFVSKVMVFDKPA